MDSRREKAAQFSGDKKKTLMVNRLNLANQKNTLKTMSRYVREVPTSTASLRPVLMSSDQEELKSEITREEARLHVKRRD